MHLDPGNKELWGRACIDFLFCCSNTFHCFSKIPRRDCRALPHRLSITHHLKHKAMLLSPFKHASTVAHSRSGRMVFMGASVLGTCGDPGWLRAQTNWPRATSSRNRASHRRLKLSSRLTSQCSQRSNKEGSKKFRTPRASQTVRRFLWTNIQRKFQNNRATRRSATGEGHCEIASARTS